MALDESDQMELDFELEDPEKNIGSNINDEGSFANLEFNFSEEVKLENNINRRYTVYKESCLKCVEEVDSFETKLQSIKQKYFCENGVISKNNFLEVLITLDVQQIPSPFLENKHKTFSDFATFKSFLDKHNLIPKYSTLLRIQDILQNKEEITVEVGLRFRIAGDHPVEENLLEEMGVFVSDAPLRANLMHTYYLTSIQYLQQSVNLKSHPQIHIQFGL